MPCVVSLCDYTGVMVRPWLLAGYDCYIVDIQHKHGVVKQGNLYKIGLDIEKFELPKDEIAFISAFPPCTHLAVSGAMWMADKGLRKLQLAIGLFARCQELCTQSGARYLIENPVSTISTYWRKPDYSFNPCDYAGYATPLAQTEQSYTKKTCLWVGGGFVMPKPKPRHPILGSKMHYLPPSKNRANLRSVTPEGFAEAVFLANSE